MNYKQIQNCKYLKQLVKQLNINLKGMLSNQLQTDDIDTLVCLLIDEKYWTLFGVEKTKKEYSYLNGLSKQAYRFIVNRDSQGRANIYFSIESCLTQQLNKHQLESLEKEKSLYFEKFKVKYDFKEKDRNIINEIVELIYKRIIQY